jgi:hypothetical protein
MAAPICIIDNHCSPDSAQSAGAGRRSPLQYDDGGSQQQLLARNNLVVASGDFHVASFTKPAAYVPGNSVVYVVSPPPARSPPMLMHAAASATLFPGSILLNSISAENF